MGLYMLGSDRNAFVLCCLNESLYLHNLDQLLKSSRRGCAARLKFLFGVFGFLQCLEPPSQPTHEIQQALVPVVSISLSFKTNLFQEEITNGNNLG